MIVTILMEEVMQRFALALILAVAAPAAARAEMQELMLPVVVNGYVREPLHYQTTFRFVNLLGVPSSLNFAVMGAVSLVGVVADQILRRQTVKA